MRRFLVCVLLVVSGCSTSENTEQAQGTVVLDASAGDGSVSGQWAATGRPTVRFESVKTGADTFDATLKVLPDGEPVQVSLTSPTTATLTWRGVTVDGVGELSDEEFAALDSFYSSPLGKVVGESILTMSCAAHDGAPAALAAMLVPYQMLLKYRVVDRVTAANDLAASVPCGFGFIDSEDPDLPRSTVVSFSTEDVVPNVFGYFPFDAAGALEPVSVLSGLSQGVRHGACASRCRGACGPDCPSTCTVTEGRCLDDGENLTGVAALSTVYTCGTHEGCRWHDQCFDDCNSNWGCGSWGASTCMHLGIVGCDSQAAINHGVGNCLSWKDGGGPFDDELFYVYPTETMKSDADLCPPSDVSYSIKLPMVQDELLDGMDLEFSVEGVRVDSTDVIGISPFQEIRILGEATGTTLRVHGRATLGEVDAIGFLRIYMSTTEPPSIEESYSLEGLDYFDFDVSSPIINNRVHFTVKLNRNSQEQIDVEAQFPEL